MQGKDGRTEERKPEDGKSEEEKDSLELGAESVDKEGRAGAEEENCQTE